MAVDRIGDVFFEQLAAAAVVPSVGRVRGDRLFGVRVPVLVTGVGTIERLQAARERYVSDPRDQGHEHGVAVRHVHGRLLVHDRVPSATRPGVRRTRGRGAPVVRHRGFGRPRHGRILLGAIRAIGRRPVVGRAPVLGPRALDVRGGLRLGPLRVAHRQHAVRHHRFWAAAVLSRAQLPYAGRKRVPLARFRPARVWNRGRGGCRHRQNFVFGRPAAEHHVHQR